MKTKINYLLGAGLSLLVTLGFTHSAAAQTGSDRIVFESLFTQTGHGKNATTLPSQIYSMNPDGSDVVPLTDYSNGADEPSWSPNQQYISFMDRDGLNLMVMDAIGEANGGRAFLVATDVQNTGSDWSPDGTAICFSGYSTQGLWIVNVNPATGEVGTPVQVAAGWCAGPSWSPDGKRIAYTFLPPGVQPGNQYVVVLDLETGVQTAFDMVTSEQPSWSPDGSRIAFEAWVPETTTKGHKTTTNYYFEVFIANADGSGATQVTHLKAPTGTGATTWSPDGKTIAFQSDVSGTWSIYRMDLSTGIVTLLDEAGQNPDWAP